MSPKYIIHNFSPRKVVWCSKMSIGLWSMKLGLNSACTTYLLQGLGQLTELLFTQFPYLQNEQTIFAML